MKQVSAETHQKQLDENEEVMVLGSRDELQELCTKHQLGALIIKTKMKMLFFFFLLEEKVSIWWTNFVLPKIYHIIYLYSTLFPLKVSSVEPRTMPVLVTVQFHLLNIVLTFTDTQNDFQLNSTKDLRQVMIGSLAIKHYKIKIRL